KHPRYIFLRLLQLALPVKNWLFLAVLLGSLTVASGIGLAVTSAYLISAAALHTSVAALGIVIVGAAIARGIFRYLERLVSHKATFRLLANLRVWFYSALEPLLPTRMITYAEEQGSVEDGGERGQAPDRRRRDRALRRSCPPLRSGDL